MPALRKSDLVALLIPPGPLWPALIEEAWSVGAAVLPVDHRLRAPEREALFAEARPTAVFDGSEVARVEGGVPVEPGVGLVVPTSGTAGRPRLAEIGRDAIEAAVRASAERLGASSEPWLCCLPLSHMCWLLVVARGIILGCPVAIHPRFDPDGVATERGAAFVSLVPTMLARLLDAGCDLARFRAILVGGA
ncbi:MAG: AMP-binding protein, partial [Acidobacteria bacterium]|nr:AMP-binding protein [Acidobacteriota bacterium]